MPIRQIYDARVRAGHLDPDRAQERIVAYLDALYDELENYAPARKSAALGWLFGGRTQAPRGLYIWGGVGRGKSMLMDLFYDRVDLSRKRRVHFHAFMAEIHEAIFAFRQAHKRGEAKGDDPIPAAAEAVAKDTILLCFDEFTVTDIADAMILGRLFKVLFARGVVMVATSNIPPRDLYRDGLNRDLFRPTIDLIEAQMEVLELKSETDYRMQKLAGADTFYVAGNGAARAALDETFRSLTGRESGRKEMLKVLGRAIEVPQARGNVARFSFADLCAKPLGPQDYLALAKRFHSIIVDDIPVLTAAQRNEAKRFIILIDTLYESHVKLFASAAAPPDALFEGTEGREAFEFARTVSRLNEMRSQDYMALPHGANGSRDPAEGIIDT
jgi:cell division protein ZapE